MFWIPQIGEAFLMDDCDGLMRATRVSSAHSQRECLHLYLMDTGETFVYPPQQRLPQCYVMAYELSAIPGRAVRCELSNPEDTQLASLLYQEVQIQILDQSYDTFLVKILPEVLTADTDIESSYRSLDDLEENPAMPQFLMDREEEEILDVEINTSDAEVAVHGFKPSNSEDRLCKFYDPKIRGCFKGGRCKLRHEIKVEDNFVDTHKIFFENSHNRLLIPRVHAKVKVEITHFLDINRFYCLYAHDPRKEEHTKSFIKEMNSNENVQMYQQLRFPPCEKQLVILNYENAFCRARIENVLDIDAETYTVLLVDFGVIIELKSFKFIYEWSTFFDYVPFKAQEMVIVNIKPISEKQTKKGIEYLKEQISGSENPLAAYIFDNIVDVECQLLLEDEDVGDILVHEGFAAAKRIFPPAKPTDLFLPG